MTPAAPLTVDVATLGRVRRLTAAGELDLTTAPVLEERLFAELRAGQDVELDLSGVPFVDSSGLRVLVQAVGVGDEHDARFTLIEPLPAQMRRVLEVTGLIERLPIAPAAVAPEA
jgi:anti-anti-sigma factor